MQQFVFVQASLYNNKCLNTQVVTKQELPKHQADQYPTYQVDSVKQSKSNKKVFDKEDFFTDKILSCARIKHSNSQYLKMDYVETVVLLSDSAQQLRRKSADIPDIYFNLLDAAGRTPTLVLNQNAKIKDRGSWISLKI